MPDSRKRVADAAFLLALMVYILAGIGLTPIHADEFMQMSMARDTFYLVQGEWDQFKFTPPVQPDTQQQLRIINGTINKTLIGLVWLLNGRSADTLPGIYAWAMPLDWNRQNGNVPTVDALDLARWPSALLTALGVIPIFLLGWQLRRRSLAYPAAILYALHPVILLNGRRAMMEGSLIFMTLLTIAWLIGMIIAEHDATAQGFMRRLPIPSRYAILGLFIGLTLAAKQTGISVAVAALLAVLITGLIGNRSWRPIALTALAGVIAFITWFALNPGYWSDPFGAVQATIAARTDLLTGQEQNPSTYKNVGQRVNAILTEPFLTPPQYFESDTWNGLIDDSIATYQHSSIDGWDWGALIGLGLTILAGFGLIMLIKDALHRDLIAWAILIWASVTVAVSLAIPFAWQRYYLPLLLVAIVLAAVGIGRLLVRRWPEKPSFSPSPAGEGAGG